MATDREESYHSGHVYGDWKETQRATRLPLIKTSLSTKNHYLRLFSREEEETSLPPIQHFNEFAKVNAHYEEKRGEFRSCIGKERAIQSQIEWRKAKNERQYNQIQLCDQMCKEYSDDLTGSIHKMVTSYAKGEIKLACFNARRYAEREERKKEEHVGRQFKEMEEKLLWKLKCETIKIIKITDFIHNVLNG